MSVLDERERIVVVRVTECLNNLQEVLMHVFAFWLCPNQYNQ